MPTRYEYWQHKVSREIYAIRLARGQVTGLAGPFPPDLRRQSADLPAYRYDDGEERITWLREREGEFLLAGK